jgi:penicillin-insensitive murein endopeptidase
MRRTARALVLLTSLASLALSANGGRAGPPTAAGAPAEQRGRLSEILGTEPPPPPAAPATRAGTPAAAPRPTARRPALAGWIPRPWDGGSISVGTTSDGYLLHAVTLPERGEGYRLLGVVPGRRTNHGTDELVAATQRAARQVAARHPGPSLVVGNLSLPSGGPIEFSESHRAGRDADFLFYALDAASGAPVEPTDFVLYKCDGTSTDGRLRFDVVRNWALVEALLGDDTIAVQYLFVSACLKRQLLAHAESAGAPKATVQRARQVLWTPSDALVHRDHFHLRIYCTEDDHAAGCRDTGKLWDWVPTRSELRHARSERLKGELRSRDRAKRLAAAREVVRGWQPELAYRLPHLLDDPDPAVRAAAAAALVQFDAQETYAGVAALLKPPTDPERFRRGLEVLVELRSEGSAWRLEQILAGTYAPLEELKPAAAMRVELRALAARGLARVGRCRSFPDLLAALEDPAPRVRDAALWTLRFLTNQRPAAKEKTPQAVADAWRRWWAAHGTENESKWHRDGFRAAGHAVPLETWTWEAVPALVAAAGVPDETGWTAHRLLRRIAKRGAPPEHPDPQVRGARWHDWWWGVHGRQARKLAAPRS